VPVGAGGPLAGYQGSGATSGHIALLLSKSGPNPELADALLTSAQLGLGDAPLEVFDTAGTAAGAEAAAKDAIGHGAGLILGPLTAAETAGAAKVTTAAGVNMLAFTNDTSQQRPGVWTLGITPAQQVSRLVAAMQTDGRSNIAALLPETDFGRAMADALTKSAATAALPAPTIRLYGGSFGQINAATRDISGYSSRRGPMDAQIKSLRAQGTPEAKHQAAEVARQAVPPPPFEALLLAETGEKLGEIMSFLPYYDIEPPHVKLLGPSLWAAPANRAGGLGGAWFAAPDPEARTDYDARFTAKTGQSAPRIGDIAFDAGKIAATAASGGGFGTASLTRASGFAGATGALVLMPDGSVRRALAIFEIDHGTATVVMPAALPAT